MATPNKTPIAYKPMGDFEFFEVAGGRDDTEWFDVIEFDDGSSERFPSFLTDPRRSELLATLKANKELTK